MVYSGGALLVPLALRRCADYDYLVPRSRCGSIGYQLVVCAQRARTMANADGFSYRVLFDSQGIGAPNLFLLPFGAWLLGIGYFLQLGRRAPLDRWSHSGLAYFCRYRRFSYDGHSCHSGRHQSPHVSGWPA